MSIKHTKERERELERELEIEREREREREPYICAGIALLSAVRECCCSNVHAHAHTLMCTRSCAHPCVLLICTRLLA